MAGETIRVNCSHCGERGVLPLDRCPTCDKPLPAMSDEDLGRTMARAFSRGDRDALRATIKEATRRIKEITRRAEAALKVEPARYTATIYVPRHWKAEPDAYAVTVLGDPGGPLVAISTCGRSFSVLERGTVVQDGQPFPSCFEAEPWMVPCRGELEASARGAS